MKVLFIDGTSILGKAIKDLTGDPVSHVALEFPNLGIIVHSNLLGLHIEWASHFREGHIIKYEIEIPSTPEEDKEKLTKFLDKYEFTMYDFGALLFLGMIFLIRKYVKIPMPKQNLWQMTGMFMCTEWATDYVYNEEDSMIRPYTLYLKLGGQP